MQVYFKASNALYIASEMSIILMYLILFSL